MNYKVYDISQEVLTCRVYPGDPSPKLTTQKDMQKGDVYNLSALSMCVHNGTHIDAPLHFIAGGLSVDKIAVDKFVGFCYLATFDGLVTAEVAQNILSLASRSSEALRKILLKGNAELTLDGAKAFLEKGVDLVGTELLSVGDESAPKPVHDLLLGREVVLLEGLRLEGVTDGEYFLNCAPLNISSAEGSPCRAILIKFE